MRPMLVRRADPDGDVRSAPLGDGNGSGVRRHGPEWSTDRDGEWRRRRDRGEAGHRRRGPGSARGRQCGRRRRHRRRGPGRHRAVLRRHRRRRLHGHPPTSDGRLTTIDHRETAPAAMGPDSFIENGLPLGFNDARYSGKSAGVPGTVAGWATALAALRHVLPEPGPPARDGPGGPGASWSTRRSSTRPGPTPTSSTTSPPRPACSSTPTARPSDVGTVCTEPRPGPHLRPDRRPRAGRLLPGPGGRSDRERRQPPAGRADAPTTPGALA